MTFDMFHESKREFFLHPCFSDGGRTRSPWAYSKRVWSGLIPGKTDLNQGRTVCTGRSNSVYCTEEGDRKRFITI